MDKSSNVEANESSNFVQSERSERQVQAPQLRDICADLDLTRQILAANKQHLEQGANQFLPEVPNDLLSTLSAANQDRNHSSKFIDGGVGSMDATANLPMDAQDNGYGPGAPANPNLHASDVMPLYERNRDRLDANHDGFINSEELDRAALDPSIRGEDAQLVALMRSNREFFMGMHNDGFFNQPGGISDADMEAFNRRQQRGTADIANGRTDTRDAALVRAFDADLHSSGERLQNTNHDVYANGDAAASIVPEACRQGSEGDCVFQAELASLARTNPQAIQNMIRDNHNGTYTVTFPGDPDNPVTVAAPTDTELASYGGGTAHGTWPAILERAYGVHAGARRGQVPGEVATHSGDSTRSTELTHELLTGRPGHDREVSSMSDRELDQVLRNSDHNPTTVFLNGDTTWAHGRHPATQLEGAHAYSVQGYDPVTRTVTLRNPWGSGEPGGPGHPRDGRDDGTFTMSYDEFRRTFSRVSY